jgi:hypothetical protein
MRLLIPATFDPGNVFLSLGMWGLTCRGCGGSVAGMGRHYTAKQPFWAHISERQTPGLTRGSPPPPHLLYKRGFSSWDVGSGFDLGFPRIHPRVCRNYWRCMENKISGCEMSLPERKTKQKNILFLYLCSHFASGTKKYCSTGVSNIAGMQCNSS